VKVTRRKKLINFFPPCESDKEKIHVFPFGFSSSESDKKKKTFFSPCHFHKEKKIENFICLLGIFTWRKKVFLKLSNKIYFSGSKKSPYIPVWKPYTISRIEIVYGIET